MSSASTTSPFVHCATEEPWVIWTEKSPVMELKCEQQATEGHHIMSGRSENESTVRWNAPSFHSSISINRPQYNAVLNRMNLAKEKTGHFTSWTI